MRARDVQLLFADAATGARSSGLVSQGRVGALINAKPSERRGLLEEAAGISGLYSRRHEAELRLKNAEGNLERLDDVLATLDEQLKGLQRQARQAARYRTISEHIKAIEAQLLYLQWLEALATIDAARAAMKEADLRVEEATELAAMAATRQAEVAAGLPEPAPPRRRSAGRLPAPAGGARAVGKRGRAPRRDPARSGGAPQPGGQRPAEGTRPRRRRRGCRRPPRRRG